MIYALVQIVKLHGRNYGHSLVAEVNASSTQEAFMFFASHYKELPRDYYIHTPNCQHLPYARTSRHGHIREAQGIVDESFRKARPLVEGAEPPERKTTRPPRRVFPRH